MHINLAVICIEMKLYSFMFTDNQTEGGGVQWEQQRAQDRTLGDAK